MLPGWTAENKKVRKEKKWKEKKERKEERKKGKIGAWDWARTSTPRGATPSRWCVYQFHHPGVIAQNNLP